MSESLIYLIVFAVLMFFMHRGHGAKGGCGGQHHGHAKDKDDHDEVSGDRKQPAAPYKKIG